MTSFLISFRFMGILKRAINALIRPPRHLYNTCAIPRAFSIDGFGDFRRYSISLTNPRGHRLVGSLYHSLTFPVFDGCPCVVYLHGNASSQLEAQFLVPNLCPHGIVVVAFDFAGCGSSDGDYVSLGKYEHEDTEFLIESLASTFHIGPFVIWGRSMGAATTLLVEHPLVAGRVCDSAFTSVRDICKAVASKVGLPRGIVRAAMWYLRKKVRARARFDLTESSPIAVDNNGTEVPVLFGHAAEDELIPFEHARRLWRHYQNPDKVLMKLSGGHNGPREAEWIQAGVGFCLGRFRCDIPDPPISVATAIFDDEARERILA
jgi:pimeloyl-ACP methyl ester carboxylesterase